MSVHEANLLVAWGKHWFGHVWIMNNTTERDNLINLVNNNLNAIGFKLGRGWQNYDPVIRRVGRPSSYAQLATWAHSQPDQGRAQAQLFLNWARGNNLTLHDLPVQLQDLAIITHLAEVARGYQSALEEQLYPWLEAIVAGHRSWGNYNDYAPSLKYKEDLLQEWA